MKTKTKAGCKKRAIVFSLYLLPFMFNIAMVEFLVPVKYDVVLNNLPLFGTLVSIAWMLSALFDFAAGDLTDKIGSRKTIQVALLLGFAGSILFGYSGNFLIMTIGMFLWGLSYNFSAVSCDTYIFSRFKEDGLGKAHGIYYFFYDMAYAFAPLLALVMVYSLGIDATIVAAGFFALITLPLTTLIDGKPKECFKDALEDIVFKDGVVEKELADVRRMNKKEFSLLLNVFICGFWFVVILMGSPLLFFHESHNLTDGALLAFSFMLPFGFMELFYGNLATSEKTRMKMINYGFFFGGALLIVFYFVQSFWSLVLLGALIALATNMAWTGSEVQISEYLPRGKKGEFMGIFDAVKDIGFDLAPMFYGFIATLGLKAPFLMLGFLLLAAWIVFAIANKEKK